MCLKWVLYKTHLGGLPSLGMSPDSNSPSKITTKLLRKSRSVTYRLVNNRASIQEFVMTPLQALRLGKVKNHTMKYKFTHVSPDRVDWSGNSLFSHHPLFCHHQAGPGCLSTSRWRRDGKFFRTLLSCQRSTQWVLVPKGTMARTTKVQV